MTAFNDGDLRAMLEARADRAAASAAADALAGARSEIRGAGQGVVFSALPVLAGRSSGIGAGWLAAAVMAVLLLVVVASRPQVAAPFPSAGSSAPGGIAGSASAAVPSPGSTASVSFGPEASLSTRISAPDFDADVRAGSADGHVFVVDSTLTADPSTPCAEVACATQYRLQDLGPVVTSQEADQPVVPARPTEGSAPIIGRFVVVPWKGEVLLVGRLDGDLANPEPARAADGSYAPAERDALGIKAVAGTLSWLPFECPTVLPDGSGCWTTRYVTSTIQPVAPGADPVTVTLWDPGLGMGEFAQADSIPGPFLVRTGLGSQLDLVGRYSSFTTIDLPDVSCVAVESQPAPSPLPSWGQTVPCDMVVDAVLAAPLWTGDITSIEVHQGQFCQGQGDACDVVAPADGRTAYAIVHLANGAWVTAVTFDLSGQLTSVRTTELRRDP